MSKLGPTLKRSLIATLSAGCAILLTSRAAPAAQSTSTPLSLPGQGASTNYPAKKVPPPPGSTTPADTFRELLAMNQDERARFLAQKPEETRKLLESKIREYEPLSQAERETRLKQAELSYYLQGLMKMAPEKRTQRLQALPQDLLPTIQERLKQWDQLPPNVQKEVLDSQTTANFFFRVPPAVPGAKAAVNPPMPGSAPLSAEAKRRLAMVNRFLELPADEQERTLETLPKAERHEMSRTIQAFAKMDVEQRKACIASFAKYNSMTPEERTQFMQNAERWKAMSPRERETWQDLIRILPPTERPSPPAFPSADLARGQSVAVSNSAVAGK